jgi:hypothetical protein
MMDEKLFKKKQENGIVISLLFCRSRVRLDRHEQTAKALFSYCAISVLVKTPH